MHACMHAWPQVRRVEGERDPRGSRLVIHGWFTEPTPFFTGGLSDAAVSRARAGHMSMCMHEGRAERRGGETN